MTESIYNQRIEFGNLFKSCRTRANLSLRALDKMTGVNFGALSNIENGERATGAELAEKLANALQLKEEEREQFLLKAASTRKKDRLLNMSRNLMPEILNFIPQHLARLGLNLDKISGCHIPSNLAALGGSEKLTDQFRQAFNKLAEAIQGKGNHQFLALEEAGKKLLCSVMVVPLDGCPVQ